MTEATSLQPAAADERRLVMFWLGTHRPEWLAMTETSLMVSHRRLRSRLGRRARLPRALAPWVLDSGGFTELERHGSWTFTAGEYVEAVERYQQEIGELVWAAPMDWMCAPRVLAETGMTVDEHQHRTVENLLELRALAPSIPFIPVLQGWTARDYERCVELYEDAGLALTREAVVGVGSIAARQDSPETGQVLAQLASLGLRLHGFGLKRRGLQRFSQHVFSADSTAWSIDARYAPPLPGHTHKSCSNCLDYALRWRAATVAELERLHVQRVHQLELF